MGKLKHNHLVLGVTKESEKTGCNRWSSETRDCLDDGYIRLLKLVLDVKKAAGKNTQYHY